ANTTAVRMEDVIPMETRRERTKKLRILSSKLQRAFYEKHSGATRPVLFETEDHDGKMLGFTDNYIRVSMPFELTLVNTVIPVELGRINADGHCEGTSSTSEANAAQFKPLQRLTQRTQHSQNTSSPAEDLAVHLETAVSLRTSGDPAEVSNSLIIQSAN
nr:hypothetical protein [Flavobacteriales bacterium]